jgi:hypothetical protein
MYCVLLLGRPLLSSSAPFTFPAQNWTLQVSFPKEVSPCVLRAVTGAATSVIISPIYFPGSKLDVHIALL